MGMEMVVWGRGLEDWAAKASWRLSTLRSGEYVGKGVANINRQI